MSFYFFQPNRSQCNLRTKSGNWVPSHFAPRVERISKHSERGQKGFFFLLLFLHFFTLLQPPGNPVLAAVVADMGPCRRQSSKRGTPFSLFYEIMVPGEWGEGSLSLSVLLQPGLGCRHNHSSAHQGWTLGC